MTRPLTKKDMMPAEGRSTVAIADKNPVIRTGLVNILCQDGRFQVAAAVPTGAAFLELVRRNREATDAAGTAA